MLFIAAALFALPLVFTGVGLLAPWTRFRAHPTLANLIYSFWTGWALVLAALQLWQLVFPIGNAAAVLVLLAGTAGWVLARRPALDYLRELRPVSALALAAFAAVPALALGSHVFFVQPHFDHGLYHEQTVMWFNQFAIVPGLGNLHHRLAFNNANFLYAALLNAPLFGGRAYFTASTSLAFVVILQCAAGAYALFEKRAGDAVPFSAASLYYALMLPAALWHFSTTHLPGYSPDVAVFALQTVLGGELLRLFEQTRESARGQLLNVALLAAAGVTVKLSFGVFAALVALAALAFWLWNRRGEKAPLSGLGLPVVLGAALVLPWMARGVLLSGYPLFPSPAFALPVTWRIPLELVEPVSPIILNWARTANQTIAYTADLNWLRQWYAAFPFDVVKRVFLLAIISSALGLSWLIAARLLTAWLRPQPGEVPSTATTGLAALVLVSALSLLGWFFLAPDYRFSGALIWMLLAAALALLCALAFQIRLTRSPLRLVVGLLMALTILVSPNHFEIHKPGQQLFYPTSEAEWVRQFIPDGAPETRTTDSGLIVYLPPALSEQCYAAPLPCTRPQDYLPSLRLIEPGRFQSGFTLLP